jgi:lysophospholipase L1-like esterase
LNGGTVHRVQFAGTVSNPPSAAPPAKPVIVGLGDSYSSGEANPLYDAGTNLPADMCHRSFLSWQRLIGVAPADQLACSGAKLQDLTSGQHAVAPDNAGQFERLRQRATAKNVDWVVLTVGGNDLGFARVLRDCVDPQTACLQQSEQFLKLQLKSLEPRLRAAYQEASLAAGGARVAVVGYPYLFPSPTSKYTNCAWMSRGEKLRFRRAQDLFEATLKRAATDAGATFVSVLDALHGRELCTAHSWMHPIASATGGVSTDQQQAHPTACGQAAIARKVIAALSLRRMIYGCDASKDLRVVIVGDTSADGLSAGLRVVGSHSARRQRLRNIDVPLTTISNPTTRSVTGVHVYDSAHFSADVDTSGSASLDADRVWYSPAGNSIRRVAACNLRYGCRPPAKSVPTRLGAVRLLNVKDVPVIRPRRFVHRRSQSGTDVEFVGVSWARWGQRQAIGKGRVAVCRTAPCRGGHVAVSLTASSLILCPIRGQARMVGYYHSLRYRRTKGGASETFAISQHDDAHGACRTLVHGGG